MKHFLSVSLTLVLLLFAVMPSVFADVGTDRALATAEAEFRRLQDLGLLHEKLAFVSNPANVEPDNDSENYWVSSEQNEAYSIVMLIRKDNYALTGMTVAASALEDDEPLTNPTPFVSGNMEYAYYDIFDRIFAPDVTIGKCSNLLAEYYGCEEEPRIVFIDTEDKLIEEEVDEDMPLGDIAYYYNRVLRISTERVLPIYAECALYPRLCYFHFGPTHMRG